MHLLLLMMLLQSSHLRLMLEMHQATGMLLVLMDAQSQPWLLLLLMLWAHNVRPVLLIMQQSLWRLLVVGHPGHHLLTLLLLQLLLMKLLLLVRGHRSAVSHHRAVASDLNLGGKLRGHVGDIRAGTEVPLCLLLDPLLFSLIRRSRGSNLWWWLPMWIILPKASPRSDMAYLACVLQITCILR